MHSRSRPAVSPAGSAPGTLPPSVETVDVPLTSVRDVAARILQKTGYSEAEAATILEVLLYAELRGSSQGLVKLLPPGLPRGAPRGPVEVEVDRGGMLLLKGNFQPAMVVMSQAADRAVERARLHGIALAGTFDTMLSTGALGYYTDRMARAGCVGIAASGTPAFVAPYGSATPHFGTNPLSIGVPSSGEPLVLDMTTAQVPWYEVLRARASGQSLPDGAAIDAAGRATTDPMAAQALRAFDGGPRGSGLSFMLELLTGPLVRAQANRVGEGKASWGNLIIAIDPSFLQPLGDFAALVTQFAASIEALPPAGGHARVLSPGKRGRGLAEEAQARGTIGMARPVWEKLCAVAEGGGL